MQCRYCGKKIDAHLEKQTCPFCDNPLIDMDLGDVRQREVGSRIGGYRILRWLSSGGMGDVYLADHPVIGTRCAVKILKTQLFQHDPVYRERMLREAKIAARLQHPNVISVLDAGIEEGTNTPYIVMEYVDGESLEEVLSDGPLPESTVIRIALQVAHALQAAHKAGIVHRDIKPSNIMLCRTGEIKLADLGVAKLINPEAGANTLTVGNKMLGTPNYSAPEQLRNSHEVDIRADIYALGATMYHMLSGVRPFSGDSVFQVISQVLEKEPEPLGNLVPDCSLPLLLLVNRMMNRTPELRPANPLKLVNQLQKLTSKRRLHFLAWRDIKQLFRNFGHRLNWSKQLSGLTINESWYVAPLRNFAFCFLAFAVVAALWVWLGIPRLQFYREHQQKMRDTYLNLQFKAISDSRTLPEFTARWQDCAGEKELFLKLLKTFAEQRKYQLISEITDSTVAEFDTQCRTALLAFLVKDPESPPELLEQLIRSGAGVNHINSDGSNLLLSSLQHGNINAAKVLLSFGADASYCDRIGRNALFFLSGDADSEFFDMLIFAGANSKLTDQRGDTALIQYVKNGDSPEMVEKFIADGVDINIRNHSGVNALTAAVAARHFAAAETLFKNGAKYSSDLADQVSEEYRIHHWLKSGSGEASK